VRRLGSAQLASDDAEYGTQGPVVSDTLENYDATESLMELARRTITPKQLATAEKILRTGCEMFRQSPMMQIFFARFHHIFTNNKHLHSES